MQLFDIPSYWKAPLSTSAFWQSRSLDLDFGISDVAHLWEATALALRHHALGDTVAFDVVTPSSRNQIVVPVLDDDSIASWRPTPHPPVQRVVVALCTDDSQSPGELAVSLGVPVLISNHSVSERESLRVTFDALSVYACRVGWLLIHIARALHHVQTRREHLRTEIPFTGLTEQFIFNDEPLATRYNRPTNLVFAPKCSLLQDCFEERAKSDPLSVAILFANIDGDFISLGQTVTYAAFLENAVWLALQLRSVGVGAGYIIPICVKESMHVTLSMLAVMIAGAAFVITDPDSTGPEQLFLLCSEIPSIGVVLLYRSQHDQIGQHIPDLTFIDPSECFKDRDVYHPPGDAQIPLMLPRVEPSATAYFTLQLDLDDRRTWTPVSHYDAIATLQNRYEEFGSGSKLRFLQLGGPQDGFFVINIWHTFIHGATLCSLPCDHDGCASITSLLSVLACTHLALSVNHLQAISLRITEESASWDGIGSEPTNTFQHRLLLRTLLLAKFPRFLWTEEPLFRMGLRLMTYHPEAHDMDRSGRAESSPIEAIKIILPEAQDPIISPSSVLKLLPLGTTLYSLGTRVVKITEDLVVKYGPFVRIAEARNALYVQKNTGISVPSVHLVFTQGDSTYIVMQCIRGRDLQHGWHLLDDSQRLSVLSQLADYLRELRGMAPPPLTPGPLDKGRCQGPWFTIYDAGPFETHAELVAWLNRKFRANQDVERFSDHHPLVFTHQDIAPRNLILDESRKLWIIDWDLAGWYPAYFEYACIVSNIGIPEVPVPDGWIDTVLPFLPDYEREYRSLKAIKWALEFTPFS